MSENSPATSKQLAKGKVLVLGCTHGGLSVIRSLGKRGLYIIASTYNPREFGLASRYIKEQVVCPHPQDEEAFIDFLLDKADQWKGALILETNDFYATVLSKNKERLSEHYRLVVPDWEVAQIFIEKDQTYALADKCGVLYPKVYRPSTMEELDDIIDEIVFPTMVKPVRSHQFYAAFKTKLFTADNPDELRHVFKRALDAELPVIVAEIIPGTDYKTLERVLVYINTHGEISAEMYNLKLRQTPPMFGMNRVGQTVPLMPEVREETFKLLNDVNFKGLAGVEFKRDPRDKRLKLIEINVRLLADTQLAIACGIDLPWIIYQDIVEDHQIKVNDYKSTYYIHFITDVIDFFKQDKDRLKNPGRYLEPYLARRKTFAYISLSDPMPFLTEARGRLLNFVGKKIRRN